MPETDLRRGPLPLKTHLQINAQNRWTFMICIFLYLLIILTLNWRISVSQQALNEDFQSYNQRLFLFFKKYSSEINIANICTVEISCTWTLTQRNVFVVKPVFKCLLFETRWWIQWLSALVCFHLYYSYFCKKRF